MGLAHRLLTVIIGVAFFVGSVLLLSTLPTSVIGNVDRNETLLTVELPPGAKLEDTVSVTQKLFTKLHSRSEVNQVFVTIGTPTSGRMGNGASAGEVNKANIYISLVPREKRKLSQEQFETDMRQELNKVPGARLAFTRIGGITGKLKVVLTSDDGVMLNRDAGKSS